MDDALLFLFFPSAALLGRGQSDSESSTKTSLSLESSAYIGVGRGALGLMEVVSLSESGSCLEGYRV